MSHRPFSVEPTVATLDVGESMQLEVEFEPQNVGNHSERLLVYYDTGMLYSKVLCAKKDGVSPSWRSSCAMQPHSLSYEKATPA